MRHILKIMVNKIFNSYSIFLHNTVCHRTVECHYYYYLINIIHFLKFKKV